MLAAQSRRCGQQCNTGQRVVKGKEIDLQITDIKTVEVEGMGGNKVQEGARVERKGGGTEPFGTLKIGVELSHRYQWMCISESGI